MAQDPIWAPNTNNGHVGGPITGTDLGGGKRGMDVSLSTVTYAVLIDEPSSTTTYVGQAEPGSLTSAASWQIKRLVVSGTQTITTFADGNSAFDNIWDDRASLSYS